MLPLFLFAVFGPWALGAEPPAVDPEASPISVPTTEVPGPFRCRHGTVARRRIPVRAT